MIKSKPISDKRLQIALHALGWFFVIAIPIYFFSTFSDRNPDRFYSFYVRTFLTGAIFYLGYLWLVPKFFLQDKKLAYFVILAALILSTHFIILKVKSALPKECKKLQEMTNFDRQ